MKSFLVGSKFFFVFALKSLACFQVWGQLSWESQEQDLKPAISERELLIQYPFKNTGKRPIHILDIKTSCGCTTATTDRSTYHSMEKGCVTVKYTIETSQGEQQKIILVQTDDPVQSTATLKLRVHVPQLLDITPQTVSWNAGEKSLSKTVIIKNLQPEAIELTFCKNDPDRWLTQLKSIRKGFEYRLNISPKTTLQPQLYVLEIQATLSKNYSQKFPIYALIRP